MRIAYGKIGRSIPLDPESWGTLGGDVDVLRFMYRLASAYPDDEIVFISRNSGESPEELGWPKNVTNPWSEWRDEIPKVTDDFTVTDVNEWCLGKLRTLDDFDAVILWLGQHGTSNWPIPKIGEKVDGEVTKPQDSFLNYVGWLTRYVNEWRDVDPINREEIWLCPDPRNYLKGREVKWPQRHPILAQFDWEREHKYERYEASNTDYLEDFPVTEVENDHVWVAKSRYEYAAVELTALPPPSKVQMTTDTSVPFGMIVNENRKYVSRDRLSILQDWALTLPFDIEIHGKWSDKSLEELGRDIQPVPYTEMYDVLRTFRCTLTTPASGSGWATSKPWEAFAAGVICFFHPEYDSQGHIIPTRKQLRRMDSANPLYHLGKWLRVNDVDQFHRHVAAVVNDDHVWAVLRDLQRKYYERSMAEFPLLEKVKRRIDGS